jgi:F-type H+-transporting ATPase subunit c
MVYLGLLALAVGLGLPISVLSAAMAQGNIGVAALEGIARQPEASSRIQTVLILCMALIESLVIYVLLTFFILSGKLPSLSTQQVDNMIRASAPAATQPNQ